MAYNYIIDRRKWRGKELNSNLAEEIIEETTIQNSNTGVEEKIDDKIIIKKKTLYLIVKRFIDIIGALLGMILLVPVTLVIAFIRVIVKEERGPIFYSQKRIGKNGKYFKLYKYRSMIKDADKVLKTYLEENEEAKKEFEEFQKLQNDPRITKLGNFLRKTSLDELPQMLNILKGDISFVGPRPIVDGEIDKYGENREKFLSVKPGLTGYWQVNGRSNTSYEDRMNMELYYVDNCSLWLDIKIFFKTFITVFKKEGAV